jgi:hypothetical protein
MQTAKLRSECKKMMTRVKANVVEARGIWPTCKAGTTDAHVQAGIWTPDSPHAGKVLNKKALVHSTATKERTLTPSWNEEKVFEVQDVAAVLEHISLVLELWEKDKAFLGWVEVPLTPLCDAQMHDVWYPLCKRKGKDKVSGELRVQITVAPINPLAKIEIIEENCSIMPDFIFQSYWNHIFAKELNLIQCQITTLSPKIAQLAQLQVLNVSENMIKVIPDEIFTLRELHTLDLSKNQLEALGKSQMSQLVSLRTLNITNNPLKDFEFLSGLNPACIVKRTVAADDDDD